jgi:uncharacterized phiE125 gp8 family phage protein
VEHVYLGKDNAINLTLKSDGVAVDLASVTRMTLTMGTVTVDSDTSAGAFDWSGGNGSLVLSLGGVSSLIEGIYDAELAIYDPSNEEGLIWGTIEIEVVDPAADVAGSGPGLVLGPTQEPLTLAEIKGALRIGSDVTAEDEYITLIARAVREDVELYTGRKLLTQTWDTCFPGWPKENYITLPYGNLQSVTSVKYKDSDGTETTMTVTDEYLVEKNDDKKGRIVLPFGITWPTGILYPSNPITVRHVCGWTRPDLVPSRIKAVMFRLITELYVDRGDPVLGMMVTRDPVAKRMLTRVRLR